MHSILDDASLLDHGETIDFAALFLVLVSFMQLARSLRSTPPEKKGEDDAANS